MTVDEILADPIRGLDLPDGAIPSHVIVIVEYSEPGSDNDPTKARLAFVRDDDLPPWTADGMTRFVGRTQLDGIVSTEDEDET